MALNQKLQEFIGLHHLPADAKLIDVVMGDILGGGSDWDNLGVPSTQLPAWVADAYRPKHPMPFPHQGMRPGSDQEGLDIAGGRGDEELIDDLRQELMYSGADSRDVERLLDFYATKHREHDILYWDPKSHLAQAAVRTGRMSGVVTSIAKNYGRAFDMKLPNLSGNLAQKFAGKHGAAFAAIPFVSDSVRFIPRVQGPLGGLQLLAAFSANVHSTCVRGARGSKHVYDLYLVAGDDFGVDSDDLTKYDETIFGKLLGQKAREFGRGLTAMWLLQHTRGYRPFVNFVVMRFRVHSGPGSRYDFGYY